ncbi:MAG: 3-isopropylmalate dehydratase small subunit [Candidatus Hadarchaeum sp.]|uniref:3-isopropylmalate dehydratase small subunit n=1 Tax=Candidatus Hadarchaeum sp. TaxID=2883567 RepID=UPI003D09C8E9
MTIKGQVWKFGDSVSTDAIISGKYKFKTIDLDELAQHAMETLAPDFARQVKRGDIIVAGENFGCGSSREQAPLVLRQLGVGAIVAKSFARIFYRNSFNVGLPVLECHELPDRTRQGDLLEIDLRRGSLVNLTTGEIFRAKPVPEFLLQMLEDGGLVEQYKKYGVFKWSMSSR